MSSSKTSQRTNRPRRDASASPLLRLAWRNIWRQKRRTSLLLIVIAYATLTTIFMWGMTDGTNKSVLANQARFLQAPILITSDAYVTDPDPENALTDLSFQEDLKRIKNVNAVVPRLEVPALLRSPYGSEIALIRGINPELEPLVSDIPKNIVEGTPLSATGQVVLGKSLAENLDVRLGERLAVDVSSLAGPQASGFIVTGLVESGLTAVDQTTVMIHIDDAKSLSGVEGATSIALDVPRGLEARTNSEVQALLPDGIQARDLETLLGALTNELDANRIQMIPIMAIFAIFAALAVTSTLLVSVLERRREFGMISSIGLAPRKLSHVITLEGIFITTFGWLIGLILGYGLTYWFSVVNVLGPLFSASSQAFASFGLGDEIYTTSKPVYALYAAVTIILAAIFAILIPARRVAKLQPAEAMRDE